MRNINEFKEIKCPLFQARNKTVEKIVLSINEIENIEQKVGLSERLIIEIEKNLLLCKYFDRQKADCQICHHIARSRMKIANLTLRAAKTVKTTSK